MLTGPNEVSVGGAAKALGISRPQCYVWVKRGYLAARRRDRHWIVPLSAIADVRRRRQRLARLVEQGAK
jgi:predicted site-specific integrase-resolvase